MSTEDQSPEQKKLLDELAQNQAERTIHIRERIRAVYSGKPPYSEEELKKCKPTESISMKQIYEATISIDREESDDIQVRVTGTVTAGHRGYRDRTGAQIDPDEPAEAKVISAVIARDVPAFDDESGVVIPGRYSLRKGQALDLTKQEQDKAETALFEAAGE